MLLVPCVGADVDPAASATTHVVPKTTCEGAGWPHTVGVIHSHPGAQKCWYYFPGTEKVVDMLNHSRWITVGIASGLLALMGATLLHAQQQPEPRRDALQTGAVTPADTALRAKPGLRIGPAHGDTLRPVHRDSAPPTGSVTAADSTRVKRDSTQ